MCRLSYFNLNCFSSLLSSALSRCGNAFSSLSIVERAQQAFVVQSRSTIAQKIIKGLFSCSLTVTRARSSDRHIVEREFTCVSHKSQFDLCEVSLVA